jgi:hypothetical protein
MESSDRYWGGSIAKEARVWLKVRYWLTVVDVEDLDAMPLCATGKVSMIQFLRCCKNLRGKDRRMFMDAECPQSVRRRLYSLYAPIPTYVP